MKEGDFSLSFNFASVQFSSVAQSCPTLCDPMNRSTPGLPWTARRSNQSILKEISPGISLEGLMLKLKLQYFGHLLQRVNSLEKNPDAGKY